MPELTTIAFDADDTLWPHERYFVDTKTKFLALVSPYAEPADIEAHLHATEVRNVEHYGYGVKGFTLSMIETALAVSGGRAASDTIAGIVALGRDMLVHPVEPFDGVQATLEALKPSHKLLLVTRGDLFDQERKLAASGLVGYFDEVEIVSGKTAAVYTRIFNRHGDGPKRGLMVGNSMRADVVPALAAGAWGVHVPSEHVWSLDLAEEPADQSRFRRFERLGQLLPLVAEIG